MREIKFRAWDNETNNMIYPEKVIDPGHHSFNMYSGSLQYYNLQNGYGTGEIMQYTGLKDKNGQDIYEGDVVKYTDESLDPTPAIVAYSGTSFSTECTITKDLGDMYGFEFEVIGNIHENPELLKP